MKGKDSRAELQLSSYRQLYFTEWEFFFICTKLKIKMHTKNTNQQSYKQYFNWKNIFMIKHLKYTTHSSTKLTSRNAVKKILIWNKKRGPIHTRRRNRRYIAISKRMFFRHFLNCLCLLAAFPEPPSVLGGWTVERNFSRLCITRRRKLSSFQ